MSPINIKKGIKLTKKLYQTEASGGIDLNNIKRIAATGVNRVSIGVLTHSVNALDLKFEIWSSNLKKKIYFFNSACAAASFATGTRYGEQET